MVRERVVAAIDVGTTKVCTLVGELGEDGLVRILGVGVVPSRGLRKGVVVNMDEATDSIRASVEKAERSSGFRVASAHVGIAGSHINSVNNRGAVTVVAPSRLIAEDDVARAIESARMINVPPNREIIHVLPRSYSVDGQDGVQNPIGMHGFRLDVEVHIITAASTAVQNLTRCVLQAGVEVDDLVLEPIAASQAVLTAEEREMGVVLADVGGGTTDISIFLEGSVWHTAVVPVGGYHLTNDVAIGLRTPFAAAEQLKVQHGRAEPQAIDPEATVEVAGFGTNGLRPVHLRQLSEVLESRLIEVNELILAEVKRSGYDGLLPAGLVLVGGTANLPGIDNLAADVLQMPVRVGKPSGLQGLVDTISGPAYAASVGLLLWGLHHGEVKTRVVKRDHRQVGTFYRKVTGWFRELLPQ